MRNALSWESFASAERDDEAGQVLTAGWGAIGQLGVGDRASRVVPHALRFSSAVVQVACGSRFTVCLTRRGVWSFGKSDDGQCGHGDRLEVLRPRLVEALGL